MNLDARIYNANAYLLSTESDRRLIVQKDFKERAFVNEFPNETECNPPYARSFIMYYSILPQEISRRGKRMRMGHSCFEIPRNSYT